MNKTLQNIAGGGVKYKPLGEVVLRNTFKQIGASELEAMNMPMRAGGGGGKIIT